jgi:small-conductance mechanosensitive channel
MRSLCQAMLLLVTVSPVGKIGWVSSATRQATLAWNHLYSHRAVVYGIFYCLLATALLILALRLLGVVFSRLYTKLDEWHGLYIRSLRVQNLELLPAEKITALLRTTARVVRAVVSIALLYAYITLVPSFFPWTRGYSQVLFGYLLSPLEVVLRALVAYVPNVFFMAIIVAVAYYAARLVRFFFDAIARGNLVVRGFYPDWAMPTYKIARFLIVAFTLVVAFPYLPGSSSPAFRGVSIFLGLLLSLGSSSAIANVVAGSVLTYTRAFSLGDRVQIGETTGDIVEKTLLVTRVRTIKNVDIAIPNAMVLSSHIVNFSSAAKERGLILHTTVTIGYDAPWRKVHELLNSAALATEHILHEPSPFVLQTSLDDSYVSYQLNAYTDHPNQMATIYSELHQNIQDKFHQAGVEIMSPHFSAVRDGNATTVPVEFRPVNYAAPGFRILRPDKLMVQETGKVHSD